MEEGGFEPSETEIVKALLRRVEAVINVGANIGYYVCLAREHGRDVVAFEPLPRNVRWLLSNLSVNGYTDVEIFPIAVGERQNIAELYGWDTGASLLKGWANVSERFATLVPVNSLDNVLGDRFLGRRLLFIVDVEGTELNVVRGAQRYLRGRPRPMWMVEIAQREHLPSGVTVNPNLIDTFRAFWYEGYTALRVVPGLQAVTEEEVMLLQTGNSDGLHCNNFLFVDESRVDEIRGVCTEAITPPHFELPGRGETDRSV